MVLTPIEDSLFLQKAPPLDPAWLSYEEEAGLLNPKPTYTRPERQLIYAAECRELTKKMTADGARDHHLIKDVSIKDIVVPSTQDSYYIPVRQYDNLAESGGAVEPEHILLYIHGGGLVVGEHDSEELSCLRILKDSGVPNLRVYSVGYRLMPNYPAAVCVSDCKDVFNHLVKVAQDTTRKASVLLVGSSSGGELAAIVSQSAPEGTVGGVVLRGPVTVDPASGAAGAKEYIPPEFRPLHHSAFDKSFFNSLGSGLAFETPRDGLPRMPLDAPRDEVRRLNLPRTWIQVCTNDFLYSDGVCYAKLLSDAGVEVQLDVIKGWPHTFWLKAPHLPEAFEADRAMLRGVAWVCGTGSDVKLVSVASRDPF